MTDIINGKDKYARFRPTERLMTPAEAADYLCISIRTLEGWRQRGGGPEYIKLSSRLVRYGFTDLKEWKEVRYKRNTSDEGQI